MDWGDLFFWGGIGLAVLFGAVVLLAVKGRKKIKEQEAEAARMREDADKDPHAPQAPAFDPRKIAIGDIIEYGTPYFVRGSVTCTEEAYTWKEFCLEAPDGTFVWLCVENEGDLRVTMWHEVVDHDLVPGKKVTYRSFNYSIDERGRASYSCAGTTNIRPESGLVDYSDYRDPANGMLLSFERYRDEGQDANGPWEVSTGQEISPSMLVILPGGAR